MIPRIRAWSRRKFALYLAATFLGIGVLVALIAVLGLLYWMDARTPVPGFGQVCPSTATASLQMDGGLADYPPPVLDALLAGLPKQADLLVRQAAKGDPCQAQVVAFSLPNGRQGMTLSLGRYPGRFHLVRRDLERRTAKGLLPFSLRYHREKTLFLDPDPGAALPVMGLVGCSLLRARDVATAETVVDGIVRGPVQRGRVCECQEHAFHASSDVARLSDLPLSWMLSPSSAAKWQAFADEFDRKFVTKGVNLTAYGAPCAQRATRPYGPSVELAAHLGARDAAAVASIEEWFKLNAPLIGLTDCRVECETDHVYLKAALRY
jgi:hypothetical protein